MSANGNDRLSPTDPTGEQHRLCSADGRVTAHIAQVGASLRGLTVEGVDAILPHPLGMPAPGASGIVLVPWPNRISGGRWTQRGETRQLAITEPKYSNASHGLLRFVAYTVVEKAEARLTLAADVYPQTGYPFHLRTRVTYALTQDGLTVTHHVTNVGTEDAPVALGAHPYLAVGDVDISDLILRSPGRTRFVVDGNLRPVSEEPVDAATDLRQGRRLAEVDLDTTYGALGRDDDGFVRHTLTAPDGAAVTLRQGPGFDFAQVFTTDRHPTRPLAVAVEPMTAAADALNSGRGLRWLTSGEEWGVEWGISLAPAPTDARRV